MSTTEPLDCDVLILGGGPVGLFLACELGAYGVRCEVHEQSAGTSVHPKANTHSARSMELYRRHGLSVPFRQKGWPAERPTDIGYFTSLLGHELGRVPMPSPAAAMAAAETGNPRWPTPEPQFRASQLVLEPLLRARAERFPTVRVYFGSEVLAFRDLDTHVEADTRRDVGTVTRRARYLIGCDGARGTVRGQLGHSFAGESAVDLEFMGGAMLTTYFRAPTLLASLSVAPAWQYWIVNSRRRNLVLSLDGGEYFVLHAQLAPGKAVESFDLAKELTDVVGKAIPHQGISAMPWRSGRALVASHYGAGRVAIAGDAAHLFTPTGGMGLNTGIEDAANLAWKLAAEVQGWAGPGLLSSYERERRPIAVRSTRFALSLARAVSACPTHPEMELDTAEGARARAAAHAHIAAVARNEFDHPGLQLGSRYDGSGLVMGPQDATLGPAQLTYEPSVIPGGRVPHVWLAPGRSLLDECGHGFTLLDFSGAGWSALEALAAARGVPLVTRTLDRPGLARELGVQRLLVRPDQIIAWSGNDDGEDPLRVLETITGHRRPGARRFDPEG